MKRHILIACLAVLPFLMNSCTTTRYVSVEPEFNQQWVGHTFADIINTFGAPDRQTENGNGGVILIYENFSTSSTTTGDYWGYGYGWYYPFHGPTYRTTVTTDRQYAHFYIGEDYKCYLVRTNYLKADGREYSPTKTIIGTAVGATVGIAVIEGISTRIAYERAVDDMYWR